MIRTDGPLEVGGVLSSGETAPLQLDSSKNLKVTGTATVSGTVTANQGTAGVSAWPVADTVADGADVTLGAKADAKSTATDTTPITAMSVLKQISASVQAPPSQVATQGTSPWIVAGAGTAGTPGSAVLTVQGITSGTAQPVQTLHEAALPWTATHVPATNTKATIAKSSGGGTVRNVCTMLTVTLAAGASAITAAAPLTVSLIDGASGGSTYLWQSYINIPATAGVPATITMSNLWLVGSQATALTLEFGAAGGTNSYESVSMSGTTLAS